MLRQDCSKKKYEILVCISAENRRIWARNNTCRAKIYKEERTVSAHNNILGGIMCANTKRRPISCLRWAAISAYICSVPHFGHMGVPNHYITCDTHLSFQKYLRDVPATTCGDIRGIFINSAAGEVRGEGWGSRDREHCVHTLLIEIMVMCLPECRQMMERCDVTLSFCKYIRYFIKITILLVA